MLHTDFSEIIMSTSVARSAQIVSSWSAWRNRECLRGLSNCFDIFLNEQLHQTRADVWYAMQWQCEIAGCSVLMCLLATPLRKGKPMLWWMAECLIWLLLLPLFPLWAEKNSGKAPHLLGVSLCFNKHVQVAHVKVLHVLHFHVELSVRLETEDASMLYFRTSQSWISPPDLAL